MSPSRLALEAEISPSKQEPPQPRRGKTEVCHLIYCNCKGSCAERPVGRQQPTRVPIRLACPGLRGRQRAARSAEARCTSGQTYVLYGWSPTRPRRRGGDVGLRGAPAQGHGHRCIAVTALRGPLGTRGKHDWEMPRGGELGRRLTRRVRER